MLHDKVSHSVYGDFNYNNDAVCVKKGIFFKSLLKFVHFWGSLGKGSQQHILNTMTWLLGFLPSSANMIFGESSNFKTCLDQHMTEASNTLINEFNLISFSVMSFYVSFFIRAQWSVGVSFHRK